MTRNVASGSAGGGDGDDNGVWIIFLIFSWDEPLFIIAFLRFCTFKCLDWIVRTNSGVDKNSRGSDDDNSKNKNNSHTNIGGGGVREFKILTYIFPWSCELKY